MGDSAPFQRHELLSAATQGDIDPDVAATYPSRTPTAPTRISMNTPNSGKNILASWTRPTSGHESPTTPRVAQPRATSPQLAARASNENRRCAHTLAGSADRGPEGYGRNV